MADKKTIQKSFFETDQDYMEQIYDPFKYPEIQFASYSKAEEEITYTPDIELEDGIRIVPVQTEALISKKVVLLPSQASKFTSEEDLIHEIRDFIHKYLDIHPFYEEITAHYVLMSWIFDKLSVVPYLRAMGDYGTGKTRFVQTLGSICYKPMILAGATSDAYIFRVIELFGGTLVINEFERVNSDLQSQITIILNNGYEKGMPVGRIEGDKNRIPTTFDVYCPKLFSTRKKFKDDALESRLISVPMIHTRRTNIPPFLDEEFWSNAQEIRNKLLYFRFKNLSRLLEEDVLIEKSNKLSFLEPRIRQTLLPIFNVISCEETQDRFIEFAKEYQGYIRDLRGENITGLVFKKLHELYIEHNGRLSVSDVKEKVNVDIELDNYSLTSQKVGRIIRDELGLKTKKSTGGLYFIECSASQLDYLLSRYGSESPPDPPTPLLDSDSKEDLEESVDTNNSESATKSILITPIQND